MDRRTFEEKSVVDTLQFLNSLQNSKNIVRVQWCKETLDKEICQLQV